MKYYYAEYCGNSLSCNCFIYAHLSLHIDYELIEGSYYIFL